MEEPVKINSISWEQFEKDVMRLAVRLATNDYKKIVCITSGGLIPAYYLSKLLKIDNIQTLNIRSYKDKQQGELKVYGEPEVDLDKCLLIDDLIDSGKTIELAKTIYPNADVAVVYNKDNPLYKDGWIVFPYEKTFNF